MKFDFTADIRHGKLLILKKKEFFEVSGRLQFWTLIDDEEYTSPQLSEFPNEFMLINAPHKRIRVLKNLFKTRARQEVLQLEF